MIEPITIAANPAYPLAGLLTLPDARAGRVSAVVLVHGSGPLDKDETIGATKLFRDLADGLAARGIASIRYDKRTHTYGKQMLDELGGSLSVEEEIIQDAVCAANMLKADPRVDARRVFVVGHSQGAMLAPRIDAEGGDFAGLVLLAGTIRTLDEVIMDQNADALSQLDEAQRAAALPQVKALKDLFDAIPSMSDEVAKQAMIVPQNHLYARYLKEMKQHPIREYLTRLHKPILVLQGDKDVQVSVEKDFDQFRTALQDHPGAVCKCYPGLNHLFMKAIYGTIKDVMEEYKVAQTVESVVLEDIARWIGTVAAGRRETHDGTDAVHAGEALDDGPFYHGTKADLKVGDLLEPGFRSNYGQQKKANFVYLTATMDAAIWGAELAMGDKAGRIYRVEPTGAFENDPNLTDKKFPGNPTRSYRTREPLRIVGEVKDWEGHAPEVLRQMLAFLEKMKQQGIEAINE